MAIVSFWSDEKKPIGKTTSIAALATSTAINNTYKILIFDTCYNDSSLEDCFVEPKKEFRAMLGAQNKTDLDTGIRGVAKAILSNKTSPEIITNYTRTIFKGRLEILTEKEIMPEEYQKQRTTFSEIVRMANRYYNLVFVDLAGIKNDQVEREILEMSNIIVANVGQTARSFNNFLDIKKNGMFKDKNNLILLIGRADLDCKYNAKNLARLCGERDAFTIPYATGLHEAVNEGHLAEYFMKYRGKVYPDINTKLMTMTNEASERIISKIKELQMGM